MNPKNGTALPHSKTWPCVCLRFGSAPVFRRFRFDLLFSALPLHRRKAEDQNLSVTRLPTMEVNAEAADFFAAHLVIGIDETKKILSLGSGKETFHRRQAGHEWK
jgi:hypothetical protein